MWPLRSIPRFPPVPYTVSRYAPSFYTLGWSKEFRSHSIGVNSLWPRTTIDSGAPKALGSGEVTNKSRNVDIMVDATYLIITSSSKITNGNFFIDDEIMINNGVKNLDKYKIDKKLAEKDL